MTAAFAVAAAVAVALLVVLVVVQRSGRARVDAERQRADGLAADAQSAQSARSELQQRLQQAEGMTVLFTAHEINPLLGAMDRVLYLGQGRAAIGTVDDVVRSDVLTDLYGSPIEVFRVQNRILVVSENGIGNGEAHRHDV